MSREHAAQCPLVIAPYAGYPLIRIYVPELVASSMGRLPQYPLTAYQRMHTRITSIRKRIPLVVIMNISADRLTTA
jgi:hypothetical protein